MAWEPEHRSPEQTRNLEAALARAREAGPAGLAVFDLDGCVMDNRPRQIHILREYASHHDLPDLYAVADRHFVDWNLRHTLSNAGLSEARIASIYPGLHEYWWRCFFSSDYPALDHAMPGAVVMVRAVARLGLSIVYLTAREESARPGTEISLRRFGFPLDGERALLEMKQDPSIDDDIAKCDALEHLSHLGRPALFFDNEPANVNLFHRRFPGAMVVFVATDHSPRPIAPLPELPVIKGFLL